MQYKRFCDVLRRFYRCGGEYLARMAYNRNAAGMIVTLANIGKLLFPLTRYSFLFFSDLRVSSRIDNIASYVLKAMPCSLYIFIITVRLAFYCAKVFGLFWENWLG